MDALDFSTRTTPRHSLHKRVPTNTSAGFESAAVEGPVGALGALDLPSRRVISDISTLDCESVKADPHFNPAVEEMPFVPPLQITIPVNLAHLALQQKQQQQQKQQPNAGKATTTTRRSSFSSKNNNTIARPVDLIRQTSCQSRLEMSQASPYPKSKSAMYVSHTMTTKSVLPPQHTHGATPAALAQQQQGAQLEDDPSLEDYANGAGAVTWDNNAADDDLSRLSYYTSPTDLYTSDDSEPIVPTTSPTKKGMVKRELEKIMCRFRHSKFTKHKTKTLQPQHVVEGTVKDYDSFGSERGFC
ncbi:MAG: hypothetical protein SGBAC_009416 [Bacillariaceae sp.]